MTLPNYQGTAEEYAKYGNSLSIWQQLALLQAWAPLIGYGQRFVNEADPYRRGLVVSDAAEWLASKTNSQADDQLVRLLADILKTPQGEALVRWCLLKAEGAK
jgi:hypothetical protein